MGYSLKMKKELLVKYTIRPALEYMCLYSEAAENLLLGTAAQESNMGDHVRQLKGGPAIGIYQIEPNTYKDVIYNYAIYRDPILKKIQAMQVGQTLNDHLRSSLFYQTIIARLIYQRVLEKLPDKDDIKELARYWKQYYNTIKGRGTVEEFIKNYATYASI